MTRAIPQSLNSLKLCTNSIIQAGGVSTEEESTEGGSGIDTSIVVPGDGSPLCEVGDYYQWLFKVSF